VARKINLLVLGGLLIAAFFSGCLRIGGSAGYWKQGTEESVPEVHQASFDTVKLLPAKPKD